jgi:hypothetical protein
MRFCGCGGKCGAVWMHPSYVPPFFLGNGSMLLVRGGRILYVRPGASREADGKHRVVARLSVGLSVYVFASGCLWLSICLWLFICCLCLPLACFRLQLSAMCLSLCLPVCLSDGLSDGLPNRFL